MGKSLLIRAGKSSGSRSHESSLPQAALALYLLGRFLEFPGRPGTRQPERQGLQQKREDSPENVLA
jgi:hypothetical protein